MSNLKNAKTNTGGNYLSAEKRLKSPSQYQQVYRSKQWGASEHFTFNVMPHESDAKLVSRLGVTVSKKVAKQAVQRNRIKRQIKEFYRCRSESILGADLVITAKPSCARANDEQRQKSLEQLWQKIHKWQIWHLANHADTN